RMTEKDSKRTLTRQERDMVFKGSDVTAAFPQMERISSFLVECYDGSKWVKSWDSAINGALPKAVKVTVQVEEEGRPVEFSTLATPRISGL
ncbi:MAG: type II secretion system protein GspJ, partial [Pseudomonadota bacterium]